MQLPGGHYDLDDPDGYMARDDIWAFLERYASSFDAPVREGTAVGGARPGGAGGRGVAAKGDPLPHRPHRQAHGEFNPNAGVVSEAQLRALVALMPEPATPMR